MELLNMDESLDVKPLVTIEGKQLELLKIESASSGQKYKLSALATITEINQSTGSDGVAQNRITFELSQIALERPEVDLTSMYPNSPKP